FANYLLFRVKGLKVKVSLIGPLYKNILKIDPKKSGYLQMVASTWQDHFENSLANEMLVLKSRDKNSLTEHKAKYDLFLNKMVQYQKFIVGQQTEVTLAKNEENIGLIELFSVLQKSRPRIIHSRLLNILKDFAKIAVPYQADDKQKQEIINSLKAVVTNLQESAKVTEVIEAERILLSSISLLERNDAIEAQFERIISLINGKYQQEFQKLKTAKKEFSALTIIEDYVDSLKKVIDNQKIGNTAKIKAIVKANDILNKYINSNENRLKLAGNDETRWRLDLKRFDLYCHVEKLFKNKAFGIDEAKTLKEANIVGYSYDELVNYATSAVVEFSKRVEEYRDTVKTNTKEYLLDNDNKKGVNEYLGLYQNLLSIITKHNLLADLKGIRASKPVLQKAYNFLINKVSARKPEKAKAISAKVVALKVLSQTFDKVKFNRANNAKDLDTKNLKTDLEHINTVYNKKKPPAIKKIAKKGSRNRISLWFAQKKSALKRTIKNIFLTFKSKEKFMAALDKITSHAVIWGSLGAAIGGLTFVALWSLNTIPGLTAFAPFVEALASNPWISMGFYSGCTVLGMIALRPIWNLGVKAFWKVHSVFSGLRAKKVDNKKIIQ
ncbi:hypothetical protein ACFL2K_03155, partial [Candidatus Margulisiibacteriota bacterium]